MTTIIHKELSYTVKGVCFHVHNTLGPMLPERFYQAALAIGLEAQVSGRGGLITIPDWDASITVTLQAPLGINGWRPIWRIGLLLRANNPWCVRR